MASTYSPNLRIELIGNGEQSNTWGTTTNTNLGTLIEQAISGLVSVDVTAGNVTLTSLNGASDQSRQMIIVATGTPGVTRTITAPAVNKVYIVYNNSNATLSFIASGGTGVSLSAGAKKLVYCDGTNFVEAIDSVAITSGSINGTTIGATTASTGAFTTLSASSTVSGTGFSTYLASPPAIGGTTAAAGKFTTLEYTGTLTGSTGILNIGSGQLYKDASGNVGIGTSSPTDSASYTGKVLDVAGPAYFRQNGDATKYVSIGTSGGLTYLQANGTGNQLLIYTNNTERMRIDSSGNVGIGTSSPGAFDSTGMPLVVGSGIGNQGITIYAGATGYSSVNFADGTTGSARYAGQVSYDHTNNALLFATNTGTDRMTIGSSGIVTMNAYGAGAATFSAAGVISSVSDETWKIKDGVPNNPDEMIQKLKPGYWFYNAEKSPIFGTDRQLGFYAQNVNEAIGIEAAPVPEEGKPWGYYDRSVLAVAVMSLQKALTTIESLTERLTALENK